MLVGDRNACDHYERGEKPGVCRCGRAKGAHRDQPTWTWS